MTVKTSVYSILYFSSKNFLKELYVKVYRYEDYFRQKYYELNGG